MTTAIQLNEEGIQHKRQGNWLEAIACYERAIRLQPAFAEAHFNLGILYRDQGHIDKALSCFESTLMLRPDVVQARFELANLFVSMKDFEAAIQEYLRVLAAVPDFHEAQFNIGNVYLEQRSWTQAEAMFRAVLQASPQDANAWTNLGSALREQGLLVESAAAYREAIRLQPGHAAAWTNLGAVLREQGHLEGALNCHREAIAHAPELAEAYLNLGNVEHQLDRHADAVRCYQQAIRLAPGHDDAWLGMGQVLLELGDVEQSRRVYRAFGQRRAADPLNTLRELTCCPTVFESAAELDEYRTRFLEVTRSLEGAKFNVDLARLCVVAPSCPFNLQFLDGNLRPLKEGFAKVYAAQLARIPVTCSRSSVGKPRVGVVAITRWASSFVPPFGEVVRRLDPDRFDVVVFCREETKASIQQDLHADHITVIGLPDRFDKIVSIVQESRCDLLYFWEIGNTPASYFLPFFRLAPTQVTSWGIQVTSGIPSIDYYLSSHWIEADGAETHYSEQLLRAESLLTFRDPIAPPATRRTRAEFALDTAQRLYGCVQNLGKFHPDFDRTLAEILRADPGGAVVVAEDRTGFAAQRLRQRFDRTIPDVAKRIIFTPNLKNADYIQLISQCDVLLDPLHFGGVSTTYDAIALGKPVITLPSGFQRGSYTSGLLRKIGVEETIAIDRDDYVRRAVDIARNEDRRLAIGSRLRSAHESVFRVAEAASEHNEIFDRLIRERRER